MSAADTKKITHDEGVDLDSFSNSGVQLHVEWTKEHENILVEWADKAMLQMATFKKHTSIMQKLICGLQFL